MTILIHFLALLSKFYKRKFQQFPILLFTHRCPIHKAGDIKRLYVDTPLHVGRIGGGGFKGNQAQKPGNRSSLFRVTLAPRLPKVASHSPAGMKAELSRPNRAGVPSRQPARAALWAHARGRSDPLEAFESTHYSPHGTNNSAPLREFLSGSLWEIRQDGDAPQAKCKNDAKLLLPNKITNKGDNQSITALSKA